MPKTKVKDIVKGLKAGGVLLEHEELVFEVSGGHEFWGRQFRREVGNQAEDRLRYFLASLDPDAPMDRRRNCEGAARDLFTQVDDLHSALSRLTALGFLPGDSADAFTQNARPGPVRRADVPVGSGGTAIGRLAHGAAAGEVSPVASPATSPDFTKGELRAGTSGVTIPTGHAKFTKGELGENGGNAAASTAETEFTKGEVGVEFTKGEVQCYSAIATEQKAIALSSAALERYSAVASMPAPRTREFRVWVEAAEAGPALFACCEALFGESLRPKPNVDYSRFWKPTCRKHPDRVKRILCALVNEELEGRTHPNMAGCAYKMFLEWS